MTKPESLTELRKQWRKEPAFNAEYAALEDEFALTETISQSGLTQAQLAERLNNIAKK